MNAGSMPWVQSAPLQTSGSDVILVTVSAIGIVVASRLVVFWLHRYSSRVETLALFLRLNWAVSGGAIVAISLAVASHANVLDHHVPESLEWWLGTCVTILLFFLTEPFAAACIFSVARTESRLPLREELETFIQSFHYQRPLPRTKLMMLLQACNDRQDRLVIQAKFHEYLTVLAAATTLAQREVLATFVINPNQWFDIKKLSTDYFAVLKATNLKKTRFYVGSDEALADSSIKSDTISSGVKFVHIKPSELQKRVQGVDGHQQTIPDFALFDDELAITMTPLDRSASSLDYASFTVNDECNITIARGYQAGAYKAWASELRKTVSDATREKRRSRARSTAS
jgi:hypothetical protein